MVALTNYFVDPAGGTDDVAAGRGASAGDPWASTQWALDHITSGAGGDQINVKAGTADVLTAALSKTTYGVPTAAKPLVFRGYTAAANDGGRGVITGVANSVATIDDSGWSYLSSYDMDWYAGNVGTYGWRAGVVSYCENSTFTTTTAGHACANGSAYCSFYNCAFYGGTLRALYLQSFGTWADNCYIENLGVGDYALLFGGRIRLTNSIVNVSGTTGGVWLNGDGMAIQNCSIISASGSGKGINAPTNGSHAMINNLVEGFTSGTGIVGTKLKRLSHNSVYNCGTAYTLTDNIVAEQNETLGESPYAKTGANTWGNMRAYFEPKNVGDVWGGSYQSPNRDRGSIQHAAAGGGSGLFIPF